MAEKQYTHDELIKRSQAWLWSHGHSIIVTEIAAVGEEPDALGFKGGWSTLIECKAHRGDFLADKKKCWRRHPETALGDYRYYCAPKGLIKPDELPASDVGKNIALLSIGVLRLNIKGGFKWLHCNNESIFISSQ